MRYLAPPISCLDARDPADLPQFDASDRNHIQIAVTNCFSDVDTVRREHVEPRLGDQASMAEAMGAPVPARGGEPRPQPPLIQSKSCFPLAPQLLAGNREKGPEGRTHLPLRNPISFRGEEPIQGEASPPLYNPCPLIRLLQRIEPAEPGRTPRSRPPVAPAADAHRCNPRR